MHAGDVEGDSEQAARSHTAGPFRGARRWAAAQRPGEREAAIAGGRGDERHGSRTARELCSVGVGADGGLQQHAAEMRTRAGDGRHGARSAALRSTGRHRAILATICGVAVVNKHLSTSPLSRAALRPPGPYVSLPPPRPRALPTTAALGANEPPDAVAPGRRSSPTAGPRAATRVPDRDRARSPPGAARPRRARLRRRTRGGDNAEGSTSLAARAGDEQGRRCPTEPEEHDGRRRRRGGGAQGGHSRWRSARLVTLKLAQEGAVIE